VQEQLKTVRQAATRLNTSPATIYRLVDAKLLPAVILAKGRNKRIIRFRAESIERFIKNREQ